MSSNLRFVIWGHFAGVEYVDNFLPEFYLSERTQIEG